MALKPAGAAFHRHARENFLFCGKGVWGEAGNLPENPFAIGIGGFPLRWEAWEVPASQGRDRGGKPLPGQPEVIA